MTLQSVLLFLLLLRNDSVPILKVSPEDFIKERLAGQSKGVSISMHCPASSFLPTSPMYVVDGLQYNGTPELIKDSIKSVTVLEAPTATALYGISGAAGVIIITTTKAPKKRKRSHR